MVRVDAWWDLEMSWQLLILVSEVLVKSMLRSPLTKEDTLSELSLNRVFCTAVPKLNASFKLTII